jgi:hypothetical protein
MNSKNGDWLKKPKSLLTFCDGEQRGNCASWSQFSIIYTSFVQHRGSAVYPCISSTLKLCTRALLLRFRSILLGPLASHLHKLSPLVLVLVRNPTLDGIVSVGLDKYVSCHIKYRSDLVRRLPFVGPQHPQTHGPRSIVGDVRMIDLGLKVEHRWLERIFFREREEQFEVTTLSDRPSANRFDKPFCCIAATFVREPRDGRLTAYGDCSGPRMVICHLCTLLSSTSSTFMPCGGSLVISVSSCTQ